MLCKTDLQQNLLVLKLMNHNVSNVGQPHTSYSIETDIKKR